MGQFRGPTQGLGSRGATQLLVVVVLILFLLIDERRCRVIFCELRQLRLLQPSDLGEPPVGLAPRAV